jgi:hypothetical protein
MSVNITARLRVGMARRVAEPAPSLCATPLSTWSEILSGNEVEAGVVSSGWIFSGGRRSLTCRAHCPLPTLGSSKRMRPHDDDE